MDLKEWEIFSHLDAHEESEVLRVAHLLEKFEEVVEGQATAADKNFVESVNTQLRERFHSVCVGSESSGEGGTLFNDEMALEAPVTLPWVYRLIARVRNHDAISQVTAMCIASQVRNVMRRLPNITHLDIPKGAKVTVVGDLHGQLHDLLHILDYTGPPDKKNYLVFNGDFVDRGAHSVEVLLVIFSLFLAAPDYVKLNRGNHEDVYVCKFYGFFDQVKNYFRGQQDFFHEACATFKELPLATVINSTIYVVHGGIKDGSETLADIDAADRRALVGQHLTEKKKAGLSPEEILSRERIQAATWSDPDASVAAGEEPKMSPRGLGTLFGEHHADAFLEKNKLSLIVRSHQMVPEGLCDNFTDSHGVLQRSEDGEEPPAPKLLTIFSASRYGNCVNKGAVIKFRYLDKDQIKKTHYRTVGASGLVMSCHQFTGDEDVGEEISKSNRHGLRECIMMNRDALSAAFVAEDMDSNGLVSQEAWAKVLQETTHVNIDWTMVLDDLIDEKNIVEEDLATPPTSPLAGASPFGGASFDIADIQLRLGGSPSKLVDYRAFLSDETLSPRMGNKHSVNFDHFYQNLRLLEQMFSYLDKDNSGSISKHEFRVGFGAALKAMDAEEKVPDLDEVFKLFDHNDDGNIDQNEFFEGFRLVGMAKDSDAEPSKERGFNRVLSPPKYVPTRLSFEISAEAQETSESMQDLQDLGISHREAFNVLCDTKGDLEKAKAVVEAIKCLRTHFMTISTSGTRSKKTKKKEPNKVQKRELRDAISVARKIKLADSIDGMSGGKRGALVFDYDELSTAEAMIPSVRMACSINCRSCVIS